MRRSVAASLALILALGACRRGAPAAGASVPSADGGAQAEPAPAVPFAVRPDANDLVFFWFDEHGSPHPAARVEEVPEARRGAVRVDPPRPEQRVPGWIYLADLRAPRPDGAFAVRSVRADDMARELAALTGLGETGSPRPQPAAPTPAAHGGDGGSAVAARSSVIIYGASWCSACHQAAAYLRSRSIAFVEKDIEQDPGAQEEMVQKATRAGVPLGSIPILDVRGHILRGFSPPEIDRALGSG